MFNLALNSYQIAKSAVIARFLHMNMDTVTANFAGSNARFDMLFGTPFMIVFTIAMIWLVYQFVQKLNLGKKRQHA